MKKRIISISLALLLAVAILPPAGASAGSAVSVILNGQRVEFSGQGPLIVEGRTLIPVRGVFEALGFDVAWNEATKTVTMARDDYAVTVTLGSYVFFTNGASHSLDVPAQEIAGRTLLPLRLVLESVGYTLIWDGEGNTVFISGDDYETDFFSLYASGDRSIPTLIGVGYTTGQIEEVVYSRMDALRGQYPNGMRWTNENAYDGNGGIPMYGFGCVAFAMILSDAAFGDLKARVHYDFSNIRVGDIIRINSDTHSVIALKVTDKEITVAEGNYNSSIRWGRTFTRERMNSVGNFVMTRYPE